jgi:hypothetical protein
MQTAVKSAAVTSVNKRSEPSKLLTRIGSTTYKVSIRFSETSKETIEDKILKLVERGAESA